MSKKDDKITDLKLFKQAKEKEEFRNSLKPNDLLSPKIVAYVYPEIYKYRTLCEWRTIYDESKKTTPDTPIMLGPQWKRFGKRIIKYKVQWINDDIAGLDWEQVRAQHRAIQEAT